MGRDRGKRKKKKNGKRKKRGKPNGAGRCLAWRQTWFAAGWTDKAGHRFRFPFPSSFPPLGRIFLVSRPQMKNAADDVGGLPKEAGP